MSNSWSPYKLLYFNSATVIHYSHYGWVTCGKNCCRWPWPSTYGSKKVNSTKLHTDLHTLHKNMKILHSLWNLPFRTYNAASTESVPQLVFIFALESVPQLLCIFALVLTAPEDKLNIHIPDGRSKYSSWLSDLVYSISLVTSELRLSSLTIINDAHLLPNQLSLGRMQTRCLSHYTLLNSHYLWSLSHYKTSSDIWNKA